MKIKEFKEKYSKKVNKKPIKNKRKVDTKWITIVTVSAFLISIFFTIISELIMPNTTSIIATITILLFIGIGIIFDIVGISITVADIKTFNSMATKRVKGASIAVKLIKNSEKALDDFAAGSPALKICLRVMWMHGLKTHSCNHGEQNTFAIGHIVMEEGEDVFSYLSEEFLNDERIRIDIKDNKQEIKFSGNAGEKEGAMLFLAREIQSGKKKQNATLISEKIGEPFPTEWVRRLKSYDSNPNSTYWSEKVLIKKKTR